MFIQLKKHPRLKSWWGIRLRTWSFINTMRCHIRGKRNYIQHKGAILQKVYFDIKGNDNQIEIGANSFLKNVSVHIYGNHHRIKIGANCKLMRGTTLWVEDEGCTLSIGDDTKIYAAHLAVTEDGSMLKIGEGCGIGDEVIIRTGDSHSILDAATGKPINLAENVTLEHHCGILPRSIILKGVHLKENTVVGVASLVTKANYEPGILLAGNPAKVVRKGITWSWERASKLMECEGRSA